MKNVIKAPKEYSTDKLNIFLAGSIDMGKAENWQDKVCFDLQEFDVQFLNPRRSDWDSSWEQSINNLKFKEQVDWELQGLEDSDIIIVYFDPNGKAPITLLELGLFKDHRMIVCCPDGYWRKGNVEIVCDRYNIKFCETYEDLITNTISKIIEIANV